MISCLIALLGVTNAPITLLFQPKPGVNLTFAGTRKTGGKQTFNSTFAIHIISKKDGLFDFFLRKYMIVPGDPNPKNIYDRAGKLDQFGNMVGDRLTAAEKCDIKGGIPFEGFYFQFPTRPVRVGDTWTYTLENESEEASPRLKSRPTKTKASINETFKLVKVDPKTVTISCQFNDEMTMQTAQYPTKSGDVGPVTKETGTATIVLDQQTGILISYKCSTEFRVLGLSHQTVSSSTYSVHRT